jgi:hypothetical protein
MQYALTDGIRVTRVTPGNIQVTPKCYRVFIAPSARISMFIYESNTFIDSYIYICTCACAHKAHIDPQILPKCYRVFRGVFTALARALGGNTLKCYRDLGAC